MEFSRRPFTAISGFTVTPTQVTLYLNTGELGVLDFGCAPNERRADGQPPAAASGAVGEDGQALLEPVSIARFRTWRGGLIPRGAAAVQSDRARTLCGRGPLTGRVELSRTTSSVLLKHPEMKFTPDSQDLLYLRMVSGLRGMMHDGRVVIDVRSPAERLIAERFS